MEFEKDVLEELFEERLTRREAVKRAAQVTAALGLGPLLIASRATSSAYARTTKVDLVRWISPRGTLDVMDDFNLWVAIRQGFFANHNIQVELIAGPISDALATTKFAAQHKADMGYPSPGVLTASIDGGIPVISAWEMFAGQVFDFSLPPNSTITSPKQLAGKTIALGSTGWSVIVDPMLVEVGVDPKSVKYVNAGAQWSAAVAAGKADAGLAWEGLRAQLLGQGIKLKFLVGQTFSKFPSNSYAIRKADLSNAQMRDVYTRFFRGMVEAFEFTRTNPRAAGQITYDARPALAKTLSPQLALDSMVQLASGYTYSKRRGQGYGFHYVGGWRSYLRVIHKLGQTKRLLTPAEVFTNQFVTPANSGARMVLARKQARAFKLNAQFAKTKVPANEPL
jgi:NitT/TauT family transport system substrate-binding protein